MADHQHHHHDHGHRHAPAPVARPALSLLAIDARWRVLGAAGALLLFWGAVLWAMA